MGLGGECMLMKTSSLYAIYMGLFRGNRSKIALNGTLVLSGAEHGVMQRSMQVFSVSIGEICDSGYHLHRNENIHSSSSAPFRSKLDPAMV